MVRPCPPLHKRQTNLKTIFWDIPSQFLRNTVVAIFSTVLAFQLPMPRADSQMFLETSISIRDRSLFDLGVTDVNSDGLLDIFTTNHSSPQSLLQGKKDGGYSESFPDSHLDQDPNFPGLARINYDTELANPGLYIHWRLNTLVLRNHNTKSISGQLELYSPIVIEEKRLAKVNKEQRRLPAGTMHTKLTFSIESGGVLELLPNVSALPISFQIAAPLRAESIYVGPNLISPSASFFDINLRDRHGMAFADINGDFTTDLFITRGGLKGQLNKIPLDLSDKLFTNNGIRFDGSESPQFPKHGCSGRQVAWVDYDTGLDISSEGSFVWLDFDNDLDMDLFWAEKDKFTLYINNGGEFLATEVGANPSNTNSSKLTAADFDNDGDLDIFAASTNGNSVIVNDAGSAKITNAIDFGLPEKSATANWVDYDNDGLVDLHAVPGGLFENTTNIKFVKSSRLGDFENDALSLWRVSDSRCTWFDSDNNGSRDFILVNNLTLKSGRRYSWLFKAWKYLESDLQKNVNYSLLFKNSDTVNNWLQIELVGPPGNRPAIGARVRVFTKTKQYLSFVGSAEGSHYSQGHYRMYFGLGENASLEKLQVLWPDGQEQIIESPEVNQFITIKMPTSND